MRFHLEIEPKQSNLILGLHLRYARLKAQMSLRELGERANISHTLIANIEHGKTVANPETLREILAILDIHYRDDEELIQSFVTRYDTIFNQLFGFYYERTKEDIQYLAEQEHVYVNSIVIIDYWLIRLFHGVLTDTLTDHLRDNLELMSQVEGHFSARQRQLFQLIVGIDQHNAGWFLESENTLTMASRIGDHRLDPLVSLYQVRNQVRMFKFMDAQKNAERTIKQFEEELYYQRAMLIRLQLAYSHISLRKFDSAIHYIDLVERYAEEYEYAYFAQKTTDLRLSIALMNQDIPRVVDLLRGIDTETITTVIARIYLAAMEQDVKRMQSEYAVFLSMHQKRNKEREYLFVKGMMMVHRGIEFTEEEFVATFEQLIARSLRALDQEVLLFGYDYLILYYQSKRMYKRALELSEESRNIRSYGISHVG